MCQAQGQRLRKKHKEEKRAAALRTSALKGQAEGGSQASEGAKNGSKEGRLGKEGLFFGITICGKFGGRKWRPELPLPQVLISWLFDFLVTGQGCQRESDSKSGRISCMTSG